MKKWHYYFVTLLALGLFFWRQKHPVIELANPTSDAQISAITSTRQNPANRLPSATSSKVSDSAVTSTNPASFDQELQKRVSEEAQLMDRVEQNEGDAEIRIKEIVKTLSPEKFPQLARQASDLSVPINERALSTYLLSEAGPAAATALHEMIVAPLVKPGPYPPHSTDETQSMQEKSLRLMAIDGLFKAAQIDPESKRHLEAVAQTGESEAIRNYAMRKLSELR